jgi:hypothetical protein
VEFAVAAVAIILLLLGLALWFVPPREGAEMDKALPEEPDTLYPSTRDRRGVRAVPRERRLSGERNGSRSTERTRQLGGDRQVDVEGDPLKPTDP